MHIKYHPKVLYQFPLTYDTIPSMAIDKCTRCGRQHARMVKGMCITCYNNASPARASRIWDRQARLRTYLLNAKCVDCGEDRWKVLEFDHVRGKHKNIAYLVSRGYSWDTIMREIEKCDVVCGNCHRLRTLERGNFWRNPSGDSD